MATGQQFGSPAKKVQQVQINFRTFSLLHSNGRGVRSTRGQPEDFGEIFFFVPKEFPPGIFRIFHSLRPPNENVENVKISGVSF